MSLSESSGNKGEDMRLVWMVETIASMCDQLPLDLIKYYFSENRKLLQDYLDEKSVFKSMFFRNIYKPEDDPRRKFAVKEKNEKHEVEDAEDDNDLENENEESDEEEVYLGPPPLVFSLYVDKVTDKFHPFDVSFIYFTRLERGPIPVPQTAELRSQVMEKYLLPGLIDKDPIQMLYSYLSQLPFVVEAKADGGSFEDKYIARFWHKLHSYAGKVAGELDLRLPEDLRVLYMVPFSTEEASKDIEAVKVMAECCHNWIQSVEKVLNDIKNVQLDDENQNETSESGVPNTVLWEIKAWEDKLMRLERMEAQLNMPGVQRAMAVLQHVGNIHATTLTSYIGEVKIYLEEAKDNVKFLGTIRNSTNLLVTSMDLKEMQQALPNLLNSLRNIWMLSKHYNTDEQICGLLDKITNILLGRVKGFVDFTLLHTPSKANVISLESRAILTGWSESFQATRRAIEESGREARWEFSVEKQFSHVSHAADVCSDVAAVADVLSQLQCCFTDSLIGCTKIPKTILVARDKINEIIVSFAKLQYDAFDPANSHHWRDHVSWFKRRVRFIDAESATVAEEVFDHLQSAKQAIDAIHEMMRTNYRRDIGRRLIAKTGHIIKKYIVEIDDAERGFQAQHQNPPVPDNLPPISGAIYWSNNIENELERTLTSLAAVSHVTQHQHWSMALNRHQEFKMELNNYRNRRYDEWRYRVSDILDANLTRTLMLTVPPAEGSQIKRYHVNFTTDLSDTLAEVKHLADLGFTVPEVARNMSLQEGKLTGIAADLKRMLDKYHSAIDGLRPAEEELMVPELAETQKALNPGHSRLTWNSLGIKEFIHTGNQHISSLISKIRQVEILRVQLQECVDYVAKSRLLCLDEIKSGGSGSHHMTFFEFYQKLYDFQGGAFGDLIAKTSTMTPLLVKVEEILVASRTQRSPRLSSYYHHWETNLFSAFVSLVVANLEDYLAFLRKKTARFTVKALLDSNEVVLEPDAACILDGSIKVIKNILDGGKKFVRFYKGTCVPVKPVYIRGQLEKVLPSFYDDLICLPLVVSKIDAIQKTLIGILKMLFGYLSEWKGYRSIWRYDKNMTCDKFLKSLPSCVEFDLKLLFYYNFRRHIESTVDFNDFRCIRLELHPLKTGILLHVESWITTLGKLLEQTAWERLEKITYKVEDLTSRLQHIRHATNIEQTLTLISAVWEMSLEFEIDYLDIQERCRTLDMYGFKSEEAIVTLSRDLPFTWHALFVKSKEIYFRIHGLKEKHCQIVMQKVARLAKKLEELRQRFMTEGPSSENMSLEEGLNSLTNFRTQLDHIDKLSQELNEYQRIFKMPLTRLEVLNILKVEFENLEEIYRVFRSFLERTYEIENLTCEVFFGQPKKYSLDKIGSEIQGLKVRFGEHTVLQNLESRRKSFVNYQNIIFLLNNNDLRQRHWINLKDRTSVETNEEFPKIKVNTFINLDMELLASDINEVVELAQEESKIEEELLVIRKRWEDRKFVLTREQVGPSSPKLTIINQISVLHEDVEHDDLVIDNMIHSSRSKFFRPDLEKMKSVLAEITTILKTWIATQENCLILARVLLTYVSADFRDLDDLKSSFEDDFKSYNKLMEEVAKKPIVSKCCLMPERKAMLDLYKSKFFEHKMSCKSLIELKQRSLPRLTFLSDQEALILLGGLTGERDIFQRVSRKIFGHGVGQLCFDTQELEDENTGEKSKVTYVSHVESFNGEVLPIVRRVDCNQPTDVWLSLLIEEMKRSTRYEMRQKLNLTMALEDYEFDHYAQTIELIALAHFEVMWTNEVEKAMELDVPMNRIKTMYKLLSEKIQALCEGVASSEDSKNQSTAIKVKNLLNLYASKRNILYQFLQKNVHSSEDFSWRSNFQLIWRKEVDDLEARQGIAVQRFGYEYQAMITFPVNTELSTRVQYAMFMALNEFKPIYLRGPIYTGKTTIVKTMSVRLGRLLVFLNLKGSFCNEDMLNTLQGLCQANCWGHFDGLDLLSYDTLSILTTHLQQINVAQSMNLKEFHLDGHKTQLGLQTGFFFISRINDTFEAGDAKSMPVSLSSQFRRVCLTKPNLSTIIQANMMTYGFGTPKTLTASLMAVIETFYKIAPKGLAKLPGLSLVRQIFSNLQTDIGYNLTNLSQAVVRTFNNILPDDDVDICMPLVREHFPETSGITLTMDPEDKKQDEISPLVEEVGAEILTKNTWPLIVGKQCSGKSRTIRSAIEWIKNKSKNNFDCEVCEVTLASYSVTELFGWEDAHGKYNFGILTSFLQQTKPYIIVLRAPMDNETSQMLSKICDTGCFETDGNHTIAVPQQVNFVLEALSPEDVPPILLARCTIFCVERKLTAIPNHIVTALAKIGHLRDSAKIHEALNALIEPIRCLPFVETVKNFPGNLDQLVSICECFRLDRHSGEAALLNVIVFAFCWSFGGPIQILEEVKKFESMLRNVLKSVKVFECVNLNEGVSVFQQTFNLKEKYWEELPSPFEAMFQICELLAAKERPILLVGGLETGILLETLTKRWFETFKDPNLVKIVNPGTQMTKPELAAVLTSGMTKLGEQTIGPSGEDPLLLTVKGLEAQSHQPSGCLLTFLGDLAKVNFLYSESEGFKKIRLSKVALICQLDRTSNTKILHRYYGANYFNVFSSKDLRGISSMNVLQARRCYAPSTPEMIVEKTHEIYVLFKKYLTGLNINDPVEILGIKDLENLLRCLQSENLDEAKWYSLLYQNCILPVWTAEGREKVKSILTELDIDIGKRENEPLEAGGQNPSKCRNLVRTTFEIKHAIKERHKFIIVVGPPGAGKHTSIRDACKESGVALSDKLVHPLFVDDCIEKNKFSGAFMVNTLVFFQSSCNAFEKFAAKLQAFAKTKSVTFFLAISTQDFEVERLATLLLTFRRQDSAIIGMTDWSEDELSFGEGGGRDILLKIHMNMKKFCLERSSKVTPTPAMLRLACLVTDSRLKTKFTIIKQQLTVMDSVLNKLDTLDNLVDTSSSELSKIESEMSQLEENHMQNSLDVETNLMALENTLEQIESLASQIPDFQRQVEVRRHDLQASTSKRHSVFSRAVEVLQGFSNKDIEKFCSRSIVPIEIELVCSMILAITEGTRQQDPSADTSYIWPHFKSLLVDEEWRRQFFEIDPERHGKVTSFQIERKMVSFRRMGLKRSQLAEDQIADALLEYCEGFLEIINTVDERIELESRLKVYQEMYANMNGEMERLKTNQTKLNNQLSSLKEEGSFLVSKMDSLKKYIEVRQSKLKIALEIKNSLESQRQSWNAKRNALITDEESLEEREIVTVAASVYLAEIPHFRRQEALENILTSLQQPKFSYEHLSKIFDPCYDDNLIASCHLSGWKEGLIKRLCVVYDPHNFLPTIFRNKQFQLHYIENIDDMEGVRETVEGCSDDDIVIFNFGSNTHLLFDVVSALKKIATRKMSIFLALSSWAPYPTRTTFINLEMTGKELRRLCYSLFTEDKKEIISETVLSKDDEDDLRQSEDQLVEKLTTASDLMEIHQDVLEIMDKIKSAQSKRKSSLAIQDTTMEDRESPARSALFPTAVLSACCDLATLLNHPFTSLTQFVEFVKGLLSDESKTLEEAHEIIFHRYCLAYANNNQLFFQTMVTVHLQILNGELTDAEYSEFIAIIVNDGDVESDEIKTDPGEMYRIETPDWIRDHKRWQKLLFFLSESTLKKVQYSFETFDWKSWYTTSDSADMCEFESGNFTSLLIATLLRPDHLTLHLQNYIKTASDVMTEPSTICLDYVHSFSSSTTPILLYIDPTCAEDPTFHLKQLADVQGIASTKVKYMALGADNGLVATDLLDTAFIRGQWLIFQNLQLVPNVIVALQRRIDEANDIHDDFRLWFTWQNDCLPQLQLLQKSIIIHCQPVRALRYHSNLYIYSLEEKIFAVDNLRRNLMTVLTMLHRNWDYRQEFVNFYWHAPFHLHSTRVLHDADDHLDLLKQFGSDGRRLITDEQLHNRLTQFLSFLYSNYIMDERDLSNIEVDVNDALLTLIVDQIATTKCDPEMLKTELCQSLLPIRKAGGNIFTTLGVIKSVDIVYIKNKSIDLARNFQDLGSKIEVQITHQELNILDKVVMLQGQVEKFHNVDYSEDTIYKESSDKLAIICEKKEFFESISLLLQEIKSELESANIPQWKKEVCHKCNNPRTPSAWIQRSGVFEKCLKKWLTQVDIKIRKFLGGIEPLDLGWLFHPQRYLTAVSIRQVISSNLGTAKTEIIITLSGISDISELKEGLHAGCYSTGIYLYGATWNDINEGPVPNTENQTSVIQNLGIVSLIPIESDKLKVGHYAKIPLHRHLGVDTAEPTFIEFLKVKVKRPLPTTLGIKFLLSDNT